MVPTDVMDLLRRALPLALVAVISSCSSTPTAPSRTQPTSTPTPPPSPALSITCPENVSTSATADTQVAVSFGQAAASGGVAPVEVSCTRQSGSLFATGTTQVQCTATDAAGQTTSCLFNVVVNTVAPRLTKTKFLAFGDSMTAGELGRHSDFGSGRHWAFYVSPAVAYPTKLQNALQARYTSQASAIEVINAGWPGEWAEDGAKRLEQLLPNVRPEVLILLEGINDLASLQDRGITTAAAAIDRMAREARLRGIGRILATLPPSRPSGPHAVADSLIQAFNARVRSIALAENAPVVDFYAGMRGDPGRYISEDGLHPTEAGYERMAELVALVIRANFEQRAP